MGCCKAKASAPVYIPLRGACTQTGIDTQPKCTSPSCVSDHALAEVAPPQEGLVSFGSKSIGLFGGVMLLANNVAGPTVSLMPSLAQEAGWFAMIMVMVVLASISACCGKMLLASMRAIPDNDNFDLRIEFTDLLRFYMPPVLYVLVMICYFGYLIVTLMSYIIQTAQVLDYAALDLFGCAYGLELWPPGFVCGTDDDSSTPFGNMTVLSASFALVACVCAPLSSLNLDDNIASQVFATLGFAVLASIWICVLMWRPGFPKSLPAATSSQGNLIGTLLFNFALMSTVPSWANEKKPSVSVGLSFLLSMGFVVIIYSAVGVVGGLAFEPYFATDENLFSKLNAGGSWVAKLTVELYPILQNLTSIPVFNIFIKYNLIQQGWPGRRATVVAFVLPWSLSIAFYTGNGFALISDLGGLIFSSVINFMVPVVLFGLSWRRKVHETSEIIK